MLKKGITMAGLLAVVTVTTASAGTILAPQKGGNGGILPPQEKQFQVVEAQLAIKSPTSYSCPSSAKISGWIMTNKPGAFQYMIAKKAGGVIGPFNAVSKKRPNGLHMATFSRKLQVHKPIEAEYRILVTNKYGQTLSNWAPLNAYCAKF
ncbi:MAG: hypothetical protein AAGE89_00615 [Pseudomonadota bacterium]